ncbi:nucleotidyltransferase family protein [Thermococcus sp.]|uniref:nucleotidyltransferase family protein n=1 Tax=Thermococcus sp. TaxID=35749 RepID=UPI0025E97180|nr:nucleotidyltransferase domain-containing protein [Thermococcus sp.]
MPMLTLEEIEEILRTHRRELEERFRVKEIGVFGSYVRGEATEEGNVGILVDFYEVPLCWSSVSLRSTLRNPSVSRLTLS